LLHPPDLLNAQIGISTVKESHVLFWVTRQLADQVPSVVRIHRRLDDGGIRPIDLADELDELAPLLTNIDRILHEVLLYMKQHRVEQLAEFIDEYIDIIFKIEVVGGDDGEVFRIPRIEKDKTPEM